MSAQNDFPEVDEEAIKTWVYPNNHDKREYQHAIVEAGLFNVRLPFMRIFDFTTEFFIIDLLEHLGGVADRSRKDTDCGSDHVQFLSMVSLWQDSLHGPHETFSTILLSRCDFP